MEEFLMSGALFCEDDFSGVPAKMRGALKEALALVVDVAANTPECGALKGSLKWGQPSISTVPKTGTPIRLGVLKSGEPALFVHCNTSLVSDWSHSSLRFEGARAVVFDTQDEIDLRGFVRAALIYHL